MNLKELRKNAGKTVKETASALGVAASSYYSYEHGERQIGLAQVLTLAKLFDCTEKEIIEAQLNSLSDR